MMQAQAWRSAHVTPPSRQQGVALAISLVMLVAMTLLGVATLSGTRLNERVMGNAQQKTIAFEAAESAMDSVWDPGSLLGSVALIPEAQFNDPQPVKPTAVNGALATGLDQSQGATTRVDITAEVSIQFCGETTRPEGSSLSADESGDQFVGLLFDVNGMADIVNSNARADHLQRGTLVRPSSGRQGSCTARGV